jgi:hypothetical protein
MKHKSLKNRYIIQHKKINIHGHTDIHTYEMQNFVHAMHWANNGSSTYVYVTDHEATGLSTTDSDFIRN